MIETYFSTLKANTHDHDHLTHNLSHAVSSSQRESCTKAELINYSNHTSSYLMETTKGMGTWW